MAFLENSAATPTDLLNEFMDFLVLHAGFTRLSNLTVAGLPRLCLWSGKVLSIGGLESRLSPILIMAILGI